MITEMMSCVSFRLFGMMLAVAFLATPLQAGVIAHWNFNSQPPDNNTDTGTLQPFIGTGTAVRVGNVTASFTAATGSSDTWPDNSNWRITNWPAQGTGNKTGGVGFRVNTTGYKNITVEWDQRCSNTASRYSRFQYTTNGIHYVDLEAITMPPVMFVTHKVDLRGVPGVEDNVFFAFRIVTEFESTATGAGANGYVAANPGSDYSAGGSTLRFDMVTVSGERTGPRPTRLLSVMAYNVWGSGVTDPNDWSTNAPQVQAIGRQLAHLKPDLIAFQEIPNSGVAQMTNFVKAYLPGYFLATNRVVGGTNPGTMGNLIASRFPILRSRSHLGRSSLAQWGFDGVFTRDLFEAEIAVPGFNDPLHLFSVHLKAFNDPTSAPRRAAEAGAISNFFVTAFLPKHGGRPYVLAGDMNEDIDRPRSYELGAIQRLINEFTGLRLATPLNPFTHNRNTWSSQRDSPTIRFDYVMPCGLLFSNMISGQVFQSKVIEPLPPEILAADSAIASDHLPVVLDFRNPYVPFGVDEISVTGGTVRLSWETIPGWRYRVQTSSNLANWITVSSDMTAAGANITWTGSVAGMQRFFRVLELR